MPNTNEEGTNRKKKSKMEGISWKKNCIMEIMKGQIGIKSPILKRNSDIRKKHKNTKKNPMKGKKEQNNSLAE